MEEEEQLIRIVSLEPVVVIRVVRRILDLGDLARDRQAEEVHLTPALGNKTKQVPTKAMEE